MNRSRFQDTAMNFIIRRAFRRGAVSRADLIRALQVSSATATRLLSDALVRYCDHIIRSGHTVVPRPPSETPACANEFDLLAALDHGRTDAISTGLFEEELPLTYVSWTNSLPNQPGVLQKVVHAIRQEKQMYITYVAIGLGESARERAILPLGLEKMNDQWRVIAQDLRADGFPVKTYVLSRILAASFIRKPSKAPYAMNHQGAKITLRVELNPQLTSDQKRVLEHELGISDGAISIATRSVHEFKLRFAGSTVTENAVWPPLVVKD